MISALCPKDTANVFGYSFIAIFRCRGARAVLHLLQATAGQLWLSKCTFSTSSLHRVSAQVGVTTVACVAVRLVSTWGRAARLVGGFNAS